MKPIIHKAQFVKQATSIEDFFGKIILINLDRRTDRLANAMEQCKTIGLHDFERVSALDGSTLNTIPMLRIKKSEYALNETVLSVLRKGTKERWKNVLFLEDDIIFPHSKDTQNIFCNSLSALHENWELLYLGAASFRSLGNPTPTTVFHHSPNLSCICGLVLCHCYGINGSMFPTIISGLEQNKYNYPLDSYYVKFIQPRRESYVLNTCIATQNKRLTSDIDLDQTRLIK